MLMPDGDNARGKAQPNMSFERTARQRAFHQCWVVLSAFSIAGGQPLNSGVKRQCS
jgi:hypothetical protein